LLLVSVPVEGLPLVAVIVDGDDDVAATLAAGAGVWNFLVQLGQNKKCDDEEDLVGSCNIYE
jgi:hypothetical protein